MTKITRIIDNKIVLVLDFILFFKTLAYNFDVLFL